MWVLEVKGFDRGHCIAATVIFLLLMALDGRTSLIMNEHACVCLKACGIMVQVIYVKIWKPWISSNCFLLFFFFFKCMCDLHRNINLIESAYKYYSQPYIKGSASTWNAVRFLLVALTAMYTQASKTPANWCGFSITFSHPFNIILLSRCLRASPSPSEVPARRNRLTRCSWWMWRSSYRDNREENRCVFSSLKAF